MKLKKVFKHIIAGLLLVITLAGLFSNKAYAALKSDILPYLTENNENKYIPYKDSGDVANTMLYILGYSQKDIEEFDKCGIAFTDIFYKSIYGKNAFSSYEKSVIDFYFQTNDTQLYKVQEQGFDSITADRYSLYPIDTRVKNGLKLFFDSVSLAFTNASQDIYINENHPSYSRLYKTELSSDYLKKFIHIALALAGEEHPELPELNGTNFSPEQRQLAFNIIKKAFGVKDNEINVELFLSASLAVLYYECFTWEDVMMFSLPELEKKSELKAFHGIKNTIKGLFTYVPLGGAVGDLLGSLAGHALTDVTVGDVAAEKLNNVATQMFDGTIARTTQTWQEAADLFTCYLLEDFSPNIETFYSFFNITEGNGNMKMISIFTIGGICLAALLLIWNIIVMMFGPITSSKDGPVKLIIRFTMVIIAIMFTKEIMNAAFAFTQTFWNELIDFEFNNRGISQAFFPFGKTNSTFLGISGILGLIVTVVAGVIIFKNFIRLFAEVIERYLVTSLLYICFPVGVATAVGTSTAPIFKSYMRMIVSQLFIMVMNIWFIRMFFQLLSNSNNNNAVDGLVWFFFVIGFLRVAQRLDSYMASLGLNVAQTGGGILDSIGGAVFMMGQGMSMIKNGGKLGSRVAGAATREAAIRTGSAGLMSAGTLMSKAGGSRKVTGNMSGAERLAEAQIARGKTPTVSVNSSLWNKMAMGNVRSASGFSSNDIRDAFDRNMSNDFLTNNKNLSSLTATNNGSVFHGYSTIGQTADGSEISAGFTLSREASADAIKYTDNYGNDWYQKFDKERSRSIQEGDMFYVNENIKALTGIDMSEVTKETEAFTNEDIGYVTKRNKGWEFSTDRGDFLAGRRKDGSYCFDAQQWHDYINPKKSTK